MLDRIFTPGVVAAVVTLWAAGVATAGGTAVVAALRVGGASSLPYVAAAALLAVLAGGVLRRARWALVVSLALLATQVLGVVGSAWELATGVSETKRNELERLGVDPELGVALNLVYSLLAVAVFAWAMRRYAQSRVR